MTMINNSINNTLQTPFKIAAVSVTTTGTQLNYLNTASGTTGTGSVVFATAPTLSSLTLSSPLAVTSGGTGLASTVANQILYSSATSTVAGLATANRGFLVTSTTGAPSISNTITAVEDQSTNTTAGTPTLLITNSTGITYPSSAGFIITIGKYSNILANTSQTINSVTPGGINFLYGDRTLLTYSNNATNDLSAFYLTANSILARWSSTNTAQQLIGTTSTATYTGSDQGGRTTSSINGISGLVNINPPPSSNVTIENVSAISGGASCNHPTSTGAITTITNFNAISSSKTITSVGASNTITITNAASYNSTLTLSAAGAGSTLAITNMYGLRLQAPTIGANTTITNRYGISQEDASATNSFAGTITGALNITATAGIVTSGATGGGFIGQFRAYSTGASLGSVSLTAANNAGNFANVLTNVSTTVARTWSLPDATGTIQLVGGALGAATATNLTFSPTTGGIIGTTTNDNVSAGTVGELDSTVVLLGSAVSLLTLTPIDVVTLVLQPGDYDVWGEVWFDVNGATIISSIQVGINTTTATIATTPSENTSNTSFPVTLAAGVAPTMTLGQCRISVATATTTTVYLVVNATFTVSTLSGYGKILARRRR